MEIISSLQQFDKNKAKIIENKINIIGINLNY